MKMYIETVFAAVQGYCHQTAAILDLKKKHLADDIAFTTCLKKNVVENVADVCRVGRTQFMSIGMDQAMVKYV